METKHSLIRINCTIQIYTILKMGTSLKHSKIRKFKLGEEPNDFAFWQAQPVEFRLSTLESIREEYNTWKYGSELRFQRVYRIVKHA